MHSRQRQENAKIARERIEILRKMKAKYPEYSMRYDQLIDRIAKKYRIPKDF